MNVFCLNRLFVSLPITAFLVCGTTASGGVAAPIFGDHMVLQREMPVPVWGTAKPNQAVTVTFAGQEKRAVSDAKGDWKITLDPLKVDAKGSVMTILCGEGDKAEATSFDDVLVGEVWFCSGQSNMECRMKTFQKEKEIAAADYPLIRHNRTVWQVCSPNVAEDFSATAYFFGLELFRDLNVPIGLINRSAGGTPIEYWMAKDALFSAPYAGENAEKTNTPEFVRMVDEYDKAKVEYEKAMKTWQEAVAGGDKKAARPKSPSAPPLYFNASAYREGRPGMLYRRFVQPVIPYAIRGFIWYQGERNCCLDGGSLVYRELLPLLIKNWRNEWGEGDIPFLYVQLPNFNLESWPLMRESMLECLAVENTGMAVTIDVGERGNIHPPNKEAVGKRLELLAMKKAYGEDVVAESPLFESMRIEGNKAILTFKNAGSSLDLKKKETTGFQIAGADGTYVPAQAEIIGKNMIEVMSPEVSGPVSVRYAWAGDPDATVYNREGLPASPFRAGE